MCKSTALPKNESVLDFILGSVELGLEVLCAIYYGRRSFLRRERTSRQLPMYSVGSGECFREKVPMESVLR